MVLEDNRFVGEVDEEFRCPICHAIIEDPIGSQCEHIFCKICINQWLKTQSSCPVDRKPLTIPQLREIPRYFRNLYSKLIIKCKFESNGCENKCSLQVIESHENECKFNPIILTTNCDKGCEAILTYNQFRKHDCNQYVREELKSANDLKLKNEKLIKDLQTMLTIKCDENEKLDQIIAILSRPLAFINSMNLNIVTKCNTKWLKGFNVYNCKSCAKSSDSAICHKCFINGEHYGHEIQIHESVSDGHCNCGDEELIQCCGICVLHNFKTKTSPLNGSTLT